MRATNAYHPSLRWFTLSLLLLISVIIAACGPAATPAPPAATQVPAQPTTASAEQYTLENPKGQRPTGYTDEKTDCSKKKKAPPWTIGVANYSLGNSWRVQMFAELQFAAKQDSRIKDLIITNADGNLAKEISDIEDLLNKGVDAILILPLTPDGIAPKVEQAYNSGIVTVVYNDRVNTTKFDSIVWVDEYKFGWIGGKWLHDKLGGKGNIVLLDGIAGTGTSELRASGALDALGSDVKVLARQPADWSYDKGKKAMEDLIAAYPKIDGVYSQGGAMSLGAVEALLAANRPLVPVTGEGYNGFLKFWYTHLKDGFSSIGPDEPTWQSVEALNTAIACLEGKTVDKYHELPLPVITDQNVGNYVRTDCPDDVWANTKMSRAAITELYKCSGQ